MSNPTTSPLMVPDLFDGTRDMVQLAIDRLRLHEPLTNGAGFYLAFSGGKDSVCIKALADMAGVKYDAHYNVTTLDPPELVRFIRDGFPGVIWERPKQAMLTMLVSRGFPTRRVRWCCAEYKEQGGAGRIVVTGIRWAESVRRNARGMFETCYRDKTKHYLHPIVDWTDAHVWAFIRGNNLPYCRLYDEGFSRLGCIGCPCAGEMGRRKEFARWPLYERNWRRAFDRLWATYQTQGKHGDRWESAEHMFEWWLRDQHSTKTNPDQQTLFE